jgi:hypothetical protein
LERVPDAALNGAFSFKLDAYYLSAQQSSTRSFRRVGRDGDVGAIRHPIRVFVRLEIIPARHPNGAKAQTSQENLRRQIPFANDANNFRTAFVQTLDQRPRQQRPDAAAPLRFRDRATQQSKRPFARFKTEIPQRLAVALDDQTAEIPRPQAIFELVARPRKLERRPLQREQRPKVAPTKPTQPQTVGGRAVRFTNVKKNRMIFAQNTLLRFVATLRVAPLETDGERTAVFLKPRALSIRLILFIRPFFTNVGFQGASLYRKTRRDARAFSPRDGDEKINDATRRTNPVFCSAKK